MRFFIATAVLLTIPLRLGAIYFPPGCQYSCWKGFYIGGSGAYAWDVRSGPQKSFSAFFSEPVAQGNVIPSTFDTKPTGLIASLLAGFNWQIHKWVIGTEADIQNGMRDKQEISLTGNPPFPPTLSMATDEIVWFGTVRGRLGFAIHHNLLYLTAGYVYGRTKTKASILATPETAGNFRRTSLDLKNGITLGGGMESAINQHWSIKLEFLYIDLGHTLLRLIDPVNFPTDFIDFRFAHRASIGRAGINYFF
jgi:outer membrane immunogenic protein